MKAEETGASRRFVVASKESSRPSTDQADRQNAAIELSLIHGSLEVVGPVPDTLSESQVAEALQALRVCLDVLGANPALADVCSVLLDLLSLGQIRYERVSVGGHPGVGVCGP